MFLKRIHEITNIGKFSDCKKKIAGLEFAPTTIIYANNGNGKSTFTSILRSIQTGNNNLLIGKKTLGSSASKKIDIDFEHGNVPLKAKFENKKWNIGPNDKILIFDTKFISENVFDGEKISDEHRTNLHRVVVGAEGKAYAEAVSTIVGKIKDCEQKKKEFVLKYSGTTASSVYTLEKFLLLKEDPDIDQKITDKQKELQFASQVNKPAELTLLSLDLEGFHTILKKKIGTAHDAAEKKIKEHATQHLADPDDALDFLSSGNSQIKDETCPFCGQDTSSVDSLISAYKTYFDDSYNKLQKEISTSIGEFTRWDAVAALASLKKEAEDWNEILNDKKAFKSLIESIDSSELAVHKKALESELEKKKQDLNYLVPTKKLEAIQESVEVLEIQIKNYNASIQSFLAKVDRKKPADIEKAIKELEVLKNRFSENAQKFVLGYNSNEDSTKKLKKERDAAIKELSDYSQQTFGVYQTSINDTLAKIGADFKVENLSEHTDLRKSGSIFCGFDLMFFGKHKVEVSNLSDDKPQLKNTLSEGDKSSLAFAFFVAILYNNKDLKEALIVVDDPISSFDSERKRATARILASIKNKAGDRPAQTILLTHESGFLKRVSKEFGDGVLYLEIIPDGVNSDGVNQSTFARLDIYERFFKPEAFEALDRIEKHLTSNTLIDPKAHEDCRIILEHAVEAKYYPQLKEAIAMHKGLGGYVDILLTEKLMDSTLVDEFKRILPDLHEPHHKGNEASKDINSSGDIKTILRDSLELLKKL